MTLSIEQWLKDNSWNLQGKVVAITGAAGGLGSIVTRYLLQLNANIIMLDCNAEKMEALKKQLCTEFPVAEIDAIKIDFSRLRSVNDVAVMLAERRVDCLILNAGVYNIPLVDGDLGYNNVFQINFIGQYLFVKKMLPVLQKTKGKVVAVSSIAMTYAKLNESDVDYKTCAKSTKIYGNSKRFLTFALSELFKDRDDVHLSIVQPGITLTPMTNAQNKRLTGLIMKLFFPKPEVAALNIVKGVFENIEHNQWIGPKIARVWGRPTITSLPESTAEERAKIFNIAENICKVIEMSNNF